MILVMGATGHVGSKIVRHLMENKHPVRCVARKFPNKEEYRGADLAIGDANNVSFLSDAMRGCTAVFTMIPPDPTAEEVRFYQNKFGEVIAESIEEAGIKKVVNLSSIGADLENATGPILGLHDQEERLNEVTTADIVHLRPAYFMENLFQGMSSIVSMNKYFGLLDPDLKLPMIATEDIATRAAFLLMNPEFDGQNIEYLLGERDVSHNEAIKVIGKALGRPDLEYIKANTKEARNAMIGSGLSAAWADEYLIMAEAMNNGSIAATVKRDATNTTPTSIERFAETTFLEEYNKALSKEASKASRASQRPERRP
ncbi:NAD(P)H azoreductase [compost metagenome]